MSKSNKEQIDEHLEMVGNDPALIAKLYDHKIANWSGRLSGSKQKYSDYIAEEFLDRGHTFDDLNKKKKRKKPYFKDDHYGVTEIITNRQEEIFAKSVLDLELEELGRIIDYQVPLKSVQGDNYGKIDLVSVTTDGKIAYLIELKMGNKETLLRAVLEVATYSHLIAGSKFKEELKERIKDKYAQDHEFAKTIKEQGISKIKKAVLFALKGNDDLPKELDEKHIGEYENLKKLINKLDISVFTISQSYPTEEVHIV